MDIGTIGAGRVAKAFARRAVEAAHTVALGGWDGPDRPGPVASEIGPGARAASRQEAARCEMVLQAVPWPEVEAALAGLPDWQGRILIDSTNAFASDGKTAPNARRSSEIVAELAVGARVVKAMNATFMSNFEQAAHAGGFRRAMFVSGDDEDAVRQVADLFELFGFAPVDLGPLASGDESRRSARRWQDTTSSCPGRRLDRF